MESSLVSGVGARLVRPDRSFHPLYSAPVEIDQSHLVREPFQVAYALERGDESYVDVPVLTEIEPGLWFGGAPEPRAPEGFDFIVNLVAAWARYDPNGIECVNVTVEDGEVTAEVAKQFGDLAHEVNRRRDLGQTILVHCQVGLNRSATVVALALMLRGMAAIGRDPAPSGEAPPPCHLQPALRALAARRRTALRGSFRDGPDHHG